MAVRFECPTCKAAYDVDDALAGKSIMCRGCQKRGSVPAATASAREPSATTATTTAPASAAVTAAAAPSVVKAGLINPTPTRRETMAIWVYGLLGVGSIATGAILSRTRVLRKLSFSSDEPPDDWRRKGPGPGNDQKSPPPAPPKGP